MPSVRPLPPALAKAAKEELNEDPQRLEADLSHLRCWISKQPHLRARTDDQFLITFLRGCKYSLERAKEKIDAFYSLRTAAPEFFADRDPLSPMMQKISKIGLIVPLGEDSRGRRVILFRVALHDPNEISMEDILKFDLMVLETMLWEDDVFVVKGVIGVFDHEGITMGHIGQYLPTVVKKIFTIVQEGLPIRQKALHYCHMPSIFETVFNLCKSAMKEKIRKRIHIHTDIESLQEHIPKKNLPKEYGGEAGTCQEIAERWAQKLVDRRGYFAKDENFGATESRRPGRPRTHQDLFGLEGSFRALAVD